MLTETTAEIAAALTLSAARRVVEADSFMRGGQYKGWLPTLFIGSLLQYKTVRGWGVPYLGLAVQSGTAVSTMGQRGTAAAAAPPPPPQSVGTLSKHALLL